MSVFVVDSNFFIQAHRMTYPLDVAVGFWNTVKELAHSGTIVSIDKVKDELYKNNDELKLWCVENLPEDFFKTTDEVMAEYGRVTAWAISEKDHFLPKALNEFLDADEADAFIVAYCLAAPTDRFVVTQEISDPKRRNKVKIPDCCDAVGVGYMNTIQLFRETGSTF